MPLRFLSFGVVSERGIPVNMRLLAGLLFLSCIQVFAYEFMNGSWEDVFSLEPEAAFTVMTPEGGRQRYFLERIFQPYEELEFNNNQTGFDLHTSVPGQFLIGTLTVCVVIGGLQLYETALSWLFDRSNPFNWFH